MAKTPKNPAKFVYYWADFERAVRRRGPATPDELARLHVGIESAKTAPERLRRLIAELDEMDRRQQQQQGDQPPPQTMAEPSDDGATIRLYRVDQARIKGKFTYEGGPRQTEHEAGNPRGIHEHLVAARGTGGGGSGKKPDPFEDKIRAGLNLTRARPPGAPPGGRADRVNVHYMSPGRVQARHDFPRDPYVASDARADEAFHREAVRRTFGRNLSDAQVGSLVGARRGDHVYVIGAGRDSTGTRYLALQLEGKDGAYTAYRTLKRTTDGMLVMSNAGITVHDTGHGRGAEILARQVVGLDHMGVHHIETSASRGPTYNGYYTWARLGYHGDLPKVVRDAHPELQQIAPRGTIREVMHAPHVPGSHLSGADWWKANGVSWEGHFDVHRGSADRAELRGYLEAKGRKVMADDLQLHEHRLPSVVQRLTESAQQDWVNAGPSEDDLRTAREARLALWRELGYDTSGWVEEGDPITD